MDFNQLNDKAKDIAVEQMYNEIQQHYICWETEREEIQRRVSEILDEYHCHQKEIYYEYEYSKVYFSTIETSFDIEKLLADDKNLLELQEELSDISDGYSEPYITFSSHKSDVSYFVDYVFDKEKEKLEFIKKYAAEFMIETGNIDISLTFGSSFEDLRNEINEKFEEVMRKNGQKITHFLAPKIEEMRIKLVNTIEKTYNYLESDEYVRDYLKDFPDDFQFDESGNKLIDEEVA